MFHENDCYHGFHSNWNLIEWSWTTEMRRLTLQGTRTFSHETMVVTRCTSQVLCQFSVKTVHSSRSLGKSNSKWYNNIKLWIRSIYSINWMHTLSITLGSFVFIIFANLNKTTGSTKWNTLTINTLSKHYFFPIM
jgi:hypothetical protein